MWGLIEKNTAKKKSTMTIFLNVDEFVAPHQQHEDALRNLVKTQSKVLNTHLHQGDFYCAHSHAIRDHFSQPLYEAASRLLFGDVSVTEAELEDANARLGVNVESQTQAGLVKVVSALNVCKKCLASGASEDESRNVTSRMRFTRSWDEPGIEILTCQRCGHLWKR